MTYPYFNLPNSPFKSYESFVDGSNVDKGFTKKNITGFSINETMNKNPIHKSEFVFRQEHGQNLDTRAKDSMRQRFEDHDLSQIYYSKENMRRIQKMLKKEIYTKTNGKFLIEVDQDENDLLVAMRAVYYEHAKFRPTKIIQQVKQLNKMTVDFIVPDMITELKQEYEYLREINRPLRPIPRAVNVHSGKQTLPSMTSLFT